MKKMILSLLAILCISISASAMSVSRARQEARFLTDKMAYELELTDEQLEDIYEINYDYFRSLGPVTGRYDVMFDTRYRNLEYVLFDWQWRRFIDIDYFLHPVRVISGAWHFSIYNHYRRAHYYYAAPRCYRHYRGGHAHTYYMDRRATHHALPRHDMRPAPRHNMHPVPRHNERHTPAPAQKNYRDNNAGRSHRERMDNNRNNSGRTPKAEHNRVERRSQSQPNQMVRGPRNQQNNRAERRGGQA